MYSEMESMIYTALAVIAVLGVAIGMVIGWAVFS